MVLRACAKLTWQNARSGSDQCSIPNAQFLSEQSERFAIRHPLRLRIAHWELNIGQILGLMSSSEYCQVIFARALSRPMRLEEGMNLAHRQGNSLLGFFPGEDAH